MFGPFKPTMAALGGLVWKMPKIMSRHQKFRQRLRMKTVDRNAERIAAALRLAGTQCSTVDYFLKNTPKESSMPAKDKYTIFSRKSKTYRKGSHKQPKWTRVTNRGIPKGF